MPVASPLILEKRSAGRIRPDLDALRIALAELGNPHDRFESILIVGTNGKGSTAAMLDAVLREHGVRTGLFTSPHLVHVEERIRLDGRLVTATDLAGHLQRLDAFPDLTYFETLTAAAFLAFAEAQVEVAVLEAGMGGSWDATRLAESRIAGLTNVGTDHAKWLGSTRSEIARDKGRALVAARHALFSENVTPDIITELGAPEARPASVLVRRSTTDGGALQLSWGGGGARVHLAAAGRHQHENAQLAVALALEAEAAGWLPRLDGNAVQRALEDLVWVGRLTTHTVRGREVLVDCAHNLEAAVMLSEHLASSLRRYNLLFGCLDDKPVEKMARVLRPHLGDVTVVELEDERAMGLERMLGAFRGASPAASIADGLDRLRDPVLAAGSLRLVGALLALEDPLEGP